MSFYENIQIRDLGISDLLYPESCLLREQVLMIPIGLRFHEGIAAKDAESHHFAALLDGEIVGIVLMTPSGQPGQWRLRQMAVRPDCQGKGIGRKLVESTEKWALQQAIRSIILHARVGAIGFYHRLGYMVQGEVFTEVGIPHRMMRKDLFGAQPPFLD